VLSFAESSVILEKFRNLYKLVI